MDGIQVHKSYAAPAEFSKATPASLAINPAAVKTDVSLPAGLAPSLLDGALDRSAPGDHRLDPGAAGFRRFTWPRARSRSTLRPSTLSSRHS